MGDFKQIRTDTRQWRSGRVKLSLLGIPEKRDSYYIVLEKDFYGRSSNQPQRFNLRAVDWTNLKRLIEGPMPSDTIGADGSVDEPMGVTAGWHATEVDESELVRLVAQSPELVEIVLRSPNLGKFGTVSLEALDRLALRIFEVKRENLDIIFGRLAESSTSTIEGFSTLLDDLSLNQVSLLSDLVYQKLKTLDLLEDVTINAATTERAVHQIIEANPWILGKGYEIVRSDRSLAEYLDLKVTDDPETRRRPDLIVKRVPHSEDILIVELKAPGNKLRPENIGQVLGYKALVKRHRPNAGQIHCFLFGYEKADTFTESSDVAIMTFGELVADLRDEYSEYSDLLKAGVEAPQDLHLSDGAVHDHEEFPF